MSSHFAKLVAGASWVLVSGTVVQAATIAISSGACARTEVQHKRAVGGASIPTGVALHTDKAPFVDG